jgi:anti-sigma factor (TIGR02949 family)
MMWFRRRAATQTLPDEPDCHEVARVLQSFLDGELGPEDAEKVAAHLALCEPCDIESSTVEAVRDAIRVQRPDIDTGDLARLERFVDEIDRHAT